jgi:site-specific recombinase XerD
MFLAYLRDKGVVPQPESTNEPENPLVEMFCRWMVHHRGATEGTIRAYRRVTGRLVSQIGSDPGRYTVPDIRDAISALSAGHGMATAEQVITATRMFLRCLAAEGHCRPGLDGALPHVASWRLASLPKHVSPEEVQKIIDACDTAEIGGARDRAMILLMARLGLRAGDLVKLRVQDIDWDAARLHVAGKGRSEVRLPLPQDAGDALLEYLTEHRLPTTSDRVFLTTSAPIRPLGNSSAVSGLVRRAIERTGIETPTTGAHLLRHSAAHALLRDGISLPSIGALLRQRSLETTAIYAKVDMDMLRSVAQPWIGGAQ